ncbi:Sortilin-related receptor, partial [Armadillidium nasatum]
KLQTLFEQFAINSNKHTIERDTRVYTNLINRSNMVAGQFRITNQNFWHGLKDTNSESYKLLSKSIEREMDQLFLNSVWAREFNRSEVISLSDGSLVVRARFYLNTPDTSAAKKLGSVFLRGLHKRHNQEWLGPYTVDITSIRFAEVLVDSAVLIVTPSSPTFSHSTSTTTTRIRTIALDNTTKRPNVGWGEWGPWSSCSPCSPNYDQIRTRKCRLGNGKGLLVSNNDLCLPEDHYLLQGEKGNMETRPCQCEFGEEIFENDEKDESYIDIFQDDYTESTTDLSSLKTSTSKLREKKIDEERFFSEENEEDQREEDAFKLGICDACGPGQVCVALAGQSFPTCRPEKNPNDPTGCGGLCLKDVEVCQALGSRAFQCHSSSQCLDDEWRCVDGLCIPQAKRCDGHLNCYDRSDENMCDLIFNYKYKCVTVTQIKCSSDEFHCGNQTSCLPQSAKCDGNVDCWDGLDEANCSNAFFNNWNSRSLRFSTYS